MRICRNKTISTSKDSNERAIEVRQISLTARCDNKSILINRNALKISKLQSEGGEVSLLLLAASRR